MPLYIFLQHTPSELLDKWNNKTSYHAYLTFVSCSLFQICQLSTRPHVILDLCIAIINLPHLQSNIPTTSAYRVYISHLKRYTPACSFYSYIWLSSKSLLKNHLIISLKTLWVFPGKYEYFDQQYYVTHINYRLGIA